MTTRALRGAALVAIFVLLSALALRQAGSLDAGFHLKAGEWILDGNGWLRADPFTYTVGDHAWVDTSWGYQVTTALVHRMAGAPGLVLGHAAIVLAVFLLVTRTSRLVPSDPLTLATLLMAGVVASELRFEIRPELASWLLLALTLHLLHRHAADRRAPLPALAAIHLVWANVHGLFVLGWAAMACFLAGLWLRDRRPDRRLLLWSGASVVVTLVNPYGWKGMIFPFTLATRLSGENPFGSSIGEFVSPFALNLSAQFPFHPRAPVLAFKILAALAVISLVPLVRKRRFAAALLIPVFLGLAAGMIRNIPVFVIACLPGIIQSLPAAGLPEALRIRRPRRDRLLAAALAAVGLAGLVVTARVVTDAWYIASRRAERTGLSWNRLALPVDAAAWARSHAPDGAVLNHLNLGGYLMWALDRPVFIDGRLEVIGEDFYRRYLETLGSEPALEAAVARYGITWMIVPYAITPRLVDRLGRDGRWRLAYADHLAAVFVRRSASGVSRDDVGGAIGRDVPVPPLSSLPGLGGPSRRSPLHRWARGLVQRQLYPLEASNLALLHLYLGDLDSARALLSLAIAGSGGDYYEQYNNLGAVLYREGRLQEAAACYRLVLEERSGDRLARERLEEIRRREGVP